MVNWCAQLGTVLANDEVIDGVSERGGFPVVQKKMRQWCLRVSAYSQRLLDGLDTIDWTDSLKETQRNWIGRSEGAEVQFKVKDSDLEFTIFTTRADTMFGVTFMVLAPESELVAQLTTPEQKDEVNAYLERTKKRTERDRITDRSVTGVFSGSYAINPFTGEAVPIWISDYVLAGYGTGAIMAVPAHDSRDYAFAKHFGLEIRPLVEGCDVSEESFDAKEGIVCNSPRPDVTPYCDLTLNGLTIKEAIEKTKNYVKEHNRGGGWFMVGFLLFGIILGFFDSFFDGQSVQCKITVRSYIRSRRVANDTFFGIKAFFADITTFYQRTDLQSEMFGESIVTAIVCRYSHDGTCTITGKYIVANPDGHCLTCERINGITSGEYTRHAAVCNTITLGTFLSAFQISVNFILLFRSSQLSYQFAFRRQHHESNTEHRICTGREDGKFQIAVFYFELYFSTFAATDPVSLSFFQRICPVDGMPARPASVVNRQKREDTIDASSSELRGNLRVRIHPSISFIIGQSSVDSQFGRASLPSFGPDEALLLLKEKLNIHETNASSFPAV